jgi:hypothetical protein
VPLIISLVPGSITGHGGSLPYEPSHRPLTPRLCPLLHSHQIEVTVVNLLVSDNVAIHWHGVHPVDEPWEDGAHGVTQAPILPGQNYTYSFRAWPAGTHYWWVGRGHESWRLYGASWRLGMGVEYQVLEPYCERPGSLSGVVGSVVCQALAHGRHAGRQGA